MIHRYVLLFLSACPGSFLIATSLCRQGAAEAGHSLHLLFCMINTNEPRVLGMHKPVESIAYDADDSVGAGVVMQPAQVTHEVSAAQQVKGMTIGLRMVKVLRIARLGEILFKEWLRIWMIVVKASVQGM
eukprot:TRINITY_DN13688_c1_g2_i1.p1 TRINITY_DN13688_c1_g2~~TRINITY_DN13688_c1_g2_i1.p1  ORF type:complete len:130 (+),score=0.58 TRINITY_DN13688_c1_g2_i1:83-472(+)